MLPKRKPVWLKRLNVTPAREAPGEAWRAKFQFFKRPARPFALAELPPAEVERMKEAAAGSKLLGRPDKRIIASKALAAFIAASIAFGVPYGLVKRHQLEVRAQQEAVQREFAQKRADLIQSLKNAGVSNTGYWAGMSEKNAKMREGFPAAAAFTPAEIVELEKLANAVPQAGGSGLTINAIIPVLKAVRPWAKSEQDFEYEKKALEEAYSYITTGYGSDAMLMGQVTNPLMEHVRENQRRPEFRKLLSKLRDYAMFGVYPFDYEGSWREDEKPKAKTPSAEAEESKGPALDWSEYAKVNKAVSARHPGLMPFNREEMKEFKKMAGESGPLGLHMILPMFKEVDRRASKRNEFWREGERLVKAYQSAIKNYDRFALARCSDVMNHVMRNQKKPAFRSVLLKLSDYAKLGVKPFE